MLLAKYFIWVVAVSLAAQPWRGQTSDISERGSATGREFGAATSHANSEYSNINMPKTYIV
jgi:hypothetical protein